MDFDYARHVPASNSSEVLYGTLLDYAKVYRTGDGFWVVAEPESVRSIFESNFPGCNFTIYETKGAHGEEYSIDLNVLQLFDKKFDVVLSQALLEHVCRPSIVLENFTEALNVGGVLALHTHNRDREYHAWPVDCVRFFKGFFVEMTKYLPLELLDYGEFESHIFVAYRKIAEKVS